jgi:hypothetical protein
MSRVIWKFLPLFGGTQTIEVPRYAVLRHADRNPGEDSDQYPIALWFEVNPEQVERELFRIAFIATGTPVPADLHYCKTVICTDDNTVWHLFTN